MSANKNRLLFLACCVVLTSCTFKAYRHQQTPLAGPLMIEPFKRGDFVIIGDIEGQACGSVLFWIFSFGADDKRIHLSGGSGWGSLLPWSGLSAVEQVALYDAVDRVRGADLIISLRSKSQVTDYWIYRKECVIVRGKALQLKPDVKVPTSKSGDKIIDE